MSATELGLLVAALAGLAALPSASVALVVARTLQGGAGAGLATAAGIVVGDLCFVLLAILGLATLAVALGDAFAVLRLLAGAGLLAFGVALLLRLRGNGAAPAVPEGAAGRLASFVAGLALTLGDGKAVLFYASLFPALVDVPALTVADVGTIALVTVLAVGGVKVLWVLTAVRLNALAATRLPALAVSRAPQAVAGTALAGTSVWLLGRG